MENNSYKFEEKTKLSDLVLDPENSLCDEFQHLRYGKSLSESEEVRDPKVLLGKRMLALRTYRNMTQEEAATKAGINISLWRHYEHGMKMPRQDRLEKIAEALSVPVQMLQPIDTYTPAGIAAILYNLRMQCGEVEIVEKGEETYIKLPKSTGTEKMLTALKEIQQSMDEITFEDAFDYFFQKENPNATKEMVAQYKAQITKWEAYVDGGEPDAEMLITERMLAEFVANTYYRMKNWKLIEYITEHCQK